MGRQIMFDDIYSPLYERLPDSGAYLERIGMPPVANVDKETLDHLVLAHQTSVPFENLDIYDAGRELSLGVRDLYEKIVTRRRGGYCFELNGAFMALLKSLGYECYAVAARVIQNRTGTMPLSHRGAIVTIGGDRYFCDVGFGGPSGQSALALDEPGAQPSGPNTFIIERDERGTVINRLNGSNKEPILLFWETPVDEVDFLALNEYSSKNKNSIFTQWRACNLVTETGSITLNGNVLRIHSSGNTVEKTLNSSDELRAALKEYYGIQVDFPLKGFDENPQPAES